MYANANKQHFASLGLMVVWRGPVEGVWTDGQKPHAPADGTASR